MQYVIRLATRLLSGAACAAVIACSPGSQTPTNQAGADQNNRFAMDLFHTIGSEPEHIDRNLFVSPAGIRLVIAMAYAGARGETAAEIRDTFRFNVTTAAIGDEIARLADIFGSTKAGDGFDLSIANGFWRQQNMSWRDEYLDTLQKQFKADAAPVDFSDSGNFEKIVDSINQWASDNTAQRIRNFVSTSDLDVSIHLILLNAIYFLGEWRYPFRNPGDEFNREAPFSTLKGETVNTVFMSFPEPLYGLDYYEDSEVQVVDLPYHAVSEDKQISMTIILPRPGVDFDQFEASLDTDRVDNLLDAMRPMLPEQYRQLMATLPRWEYSPDTIDLEKTLQRMGMRLAFTPQADFSGMTDGIRLFISRVAQKTFVKVDEKGTEAAAVSKVALSIVSLSYPQVEVEHFHANRPFIYLIRHHNSGTILFAGRMADPTDTGTERTGSAE